MRQKMRGFSYPEVITVDEIRVVAGGDALQHRMGLVDDKIVPAHMRHLQRRVCGRDPHHLSFDPVETRGRFVFKPPRCQHLHADADAQEGAALDAHRVFDGLV